MAKLKPTFDQIYRTFYNSKLTDFGLVEGKDYKIINDSSLFQESDKLENFAVVMLKSYGGTKSSILGVDATNLKLQVIVNTDQPQKWKMIMDKITEQTNGSFTPLTFTENEDFEGVSYYFFQTLNSANVISINAEQVSTSTRLNVQTSGNIYYTSQRLDFSVDLEIEIEGVYEEVSRMTFNNFNYTNQVETINDTNSDIFKNIETGIVRTFTFSFILDDENTAQLFLINKFLDGDSETLAIKLYMHNLEVYKEYDVLISDLKIVGQIGQSGTLEVTFTESGL